MRIRTIKPGFWLHEGISTLSDRATVLAVAILNYSDDDGYFVFHPTLIKAGLFPLRDHFSLSAIREAFIELQRVRYVEFSQGGGKIIGRIVGFAEHQVINRKVKSRISELCGEPYELLTESSVSNQCPLTEPSSGNGREWNGEERNGRVETTSLPKSPEDFTDGGNEEPQATTEKQGELIPSEGARFAKWFLSTLPGYNAEHPDRSTDYAARIIRSAKTPAASAKALDRTLQDWAECYEAMIRLDHRTPTQIAAVCKFARTDEFWRSNILSPLKLRKRNADKLPYFDVLLVRIESKETVVTDSPDHQPKAAPKWGQEAW